MQPSTKEKYNFPGLITKEVKLPAPTNTGKIARQPETPTLPHASGIGHGTAVEPAKRGPGRPRKIL